VLECKKKRINAVNWLWSVCLHTHTHTVSSTVQKRVKLSLCLLKHHMLKTRVVELSLHPVRIIIEEGHELLRFPHRPPYSQRNIHRYPLALWRRNFLLNFSTPVFKMWILQEPRKVALWNKRHLEERKNWECAACLKYSVSIFVEYIFKCKLVEISCAVRPS
jgi:hypothetical protein